MSIFDDLLNKILPDSGQPREDDHEEEPIDSEQKNESFLDLIKAIKKALDGK